MKIVSSHSLAVSDDPEGQWFLKTLVRREQARRSFIAADNDNSFRRALLRRTRPSRAQYQRGDWVLYWRRKGVSRKERGRWYGPSQVIVCEGDRVVWLSHCGRLIRASPEHLRPASLREYHLLPRDDQGDVMDEKLKEGKGPREFLDLDELH